MTSDQLIAQVQKYYSDSRISEFSKSGISRGRKHSISSKVEDLIASFISDHLDDDSLEFWVDYPMSFKSERKLTKNQNPASITIYPDIAIVKKSVNGFVIKHIIDIKLDLGWKRDLKETIDKAHTTIYDLRKVRRGSLKQLDEYGNKSTQSISIDFFDQIIWHVVVISDQNITASQMRQNEDYANEISARHPLHFYVFTREKHPNGGQPVIQHAEIERFLGNIKNDTKSEQARTNKNNKLNEFHLKKPKRLFVSFV